ncbi:hypothetical protein [Acutalibacter sp. 1XD8-36]|uniref:hypothetical protein n=1 Tax=Acutalibacter sp. 1XD8-36 TaxID=2320852 RepID=UPI00262A4F2C|nr:hypothetical protein [Acutalibacter sp. 1XD8-36]
MSARIENGRPVWYEPVKVRYTKVTGTEDVEVNGQTVKRLAGDVTEITMTPEELNAMRWTVVEPKAHWENVEDGKRAFFYGAGCNSKISGDIQNLNKVAENLADEFFEGRISESQLAGKFESIANKFIETCREKQYPFPLLTGMDEEAMSFVYDRFRGAILKSAAARNNAEGKALCSKYNRGWHYYNADYYYMSERAIGAISGKAKDMASEKGFDQFEIPDYKAIGKNSLYNFNSAVSGESDYIPGGLRAVEEKWIMDFDMTPPEGFKWFYEAEGRNEDVVMVEGDEVPSPKSTVWAMYEDMLISSSFDFSVGHDQPSDIKNLAELLQFRPSGRKELAAVNKFMKNFQVAPRWYYREQAQRETKERIERAGWNVNA